MWLLGQQVAVGADDEILGFITTLPLDACALEIEDLFVDPDWMRTGVASRLVEDLVATASPHFPRNDAVSRRLSAVGGVALGGICWHRRPGAWTRSVSRAGM